MKTLKMGSQGADVQTLQLALSRSGYYFGELDGFFEGNTLRAVIRFQQNFRLPPNGVVTNIVWNYLLPYIRGYFKKRVQQGETFWTLAQRYHTSVRSIATANPGVDAQSLQVGQMLTIPFGFPAVPTNISYTSHLTSYVVEGLCARYPFLRRGQIGKSVMGKEIAFLAIGNGAKEAVYHAAHHANEWITIPILLRYLEDYALEYSRGGKIYGVWAEQLYQKVTLFVIPLVNPDGVDLVAGALNSGNYYNAARKYAQNYSDIPFPSGWKANISGIDLNLQYPAGWQEAKKIKFEKGFTSPAPRDYVGNYPLEAPESRAMYDFTLNHDFSLILAYHTQGEVIYWKYKDYLPKDSYEIAKKMGQSSGYTVEETPSASGNAGYKDWFIKQYNRPGYTIEAGCGENPLPISQFDAIYEKNIGILSLGMIEI